MYGHGIDAELEEEAQIEELRAILKDARLRFPHKIQREALKREMAVVIRDAARGSVGDAPSEAAASPAAQAPVPMEIAPRAGASETGIGHRVLEILALRPRAPIREMALMVYEDDGERACANVRSHLAQLKKKGKARMIEAGVWEAIAPRSE